MLGSDHRCGVDSELPAVDRVGVVPLGVLPRVEFENNFKGTSSRHSFQRLVPGAFNFQRGFDRVNLHRPTSGSSVCACWWNSTRSTKKMSRYPWREGH